MARVTIFDVAEAAGVSITTVSMVFNGKGKISTKTRQRVLAEAQRLGYVPSQKGPQKGKRRNRIALLVEEQSLEPQRDYFIAEVIRGIKQVVQARNYELETYVIPRSLSVRKQLPDPVLYREVRGVIILEGGDLSDSYVSEVYATGLPLVLADNFVYDKPIHSVTIDNMTGGFLVTRRLIEQGHRRVGFIRGSPKYKPLVERYLGYLHALEEAGIPYDPRLAPPRVAGGHYKGYYEMLTLLDLDDPPTAVFAVSDKCAVNALKAAQSRGVRIPQEGMRTKSWTCCER